MCTQAAVILKTHKLLDLPLTILEMNFGDFGPVHFTVRASTFLAVLILKELEESAERSLSGRTSRTRTQS